MVENRKDCFGILNNVFPVGKDGLRETVPECFDCPDKKECMQAALATKEGLSFRGELVDRAAAGGLLGRIRRWSEKKTLGRLMKQKGNCSGR